jgi:hypothetical protein
VAIAFRIIGVFLIAIAIQDVFHIADLNARRSGGAALAAALGGEIDNYLKVIARLSLRRPYTRRDDILRALADERERSPKITSGDQNLRRAG